MDLFLGLTKMGERLKMVNIQFGPIGFADVGTGVNIIGIVTAGSFIFSCHYGPSANIHPNCLIVVATGSLISGIDDVM
jgi:hypothetical protein